MADAIRQGKGVQKDINEAVIWYKMVRKRKPLTYASLAQIYLENLDGLGNMKEALRWLKLGAEANEPYSQMRLGDAYLSGTEVEKSKAKQKSGMRGPCKILSISDS